MSEIDGRIAPARKYDKNTEVDFLKAIELLTWNERVLTRLGLWPNNLNDFVFSFLAFYLTLHCLMDSAQLYESIDNLALVVYNVAENATLIMILSKMTIYRLHSSRLKDILNDIQKDYSINVYRTQDEVQAFLKYNFMAKYFMKVTLPLTFIGSSMYYLIPLISRLTIKQDFNASTFYQLPYHTKIFFEITELRTYVLIYIYQALIVYIAVFGLTGTDCFLITLVFHFCGQFSVLKHRTKDTFSKNGIQNIGDIASMHQRLLRLIRNVDETFSILMLQQIIVIMIILCFGGYVMITTRNEKSAEAFTYFIYVAVLTALLFGYCFIGECLITESSSWQNTLYDLEWYENISLVNSKSFAICLTQAKKSVALSAGGIYKLSFNTFLEVVKTSIAYLSVLRKFI